MKAILKTLLANAILFLMPFFVFAQVGAPQGITNPLAASGVNSVDDIIINGIKWMSGLVAILAIMGVVYGGLLIILGFTDEGKVKQGKQIIYWAIIGLVTAMLSYVIINTVVRSVLGVQA